MTKISTEQAREKARLFLGVAFSSAFRVTKETYRANKISFHKFNAGFELVSESDGKSEMYFTGENSENLVRRAEHDPIAFEAAKELCIDLLRQGRLIPEPLNSWLAKYLETGERPKNRKHKADKRPRDAIITTTISALKEAGYKPIMHDDANYKEPTPAGKKSACHIVAGVYTEKTGEYITPQTVRKIWNKTTKRQSRILNNSSLPTLLKEHCKK